MPAAYNQSIYLMVGVPYLSLTVLGLLIRRGCKKNAAYLKARVQTAEVFKTSEVLPDAEKK